MNKLEIWFFWGEKKIPHNRIDNPWACLMKKKWEQKQILNKRNEKGKITTDAEEMKIIVSMRIGVSHWTACVYMCLCEEDALF